MAFGGSQSTKRSSRVLHRFSDFGLCKLYKLPGKAADSKIRGVAQNNFRGKYCRGFYIMSDEKKCLKCGSHNIVPCELQSTGKVYARPKHAKLLTIFTTGVVLHADVCFDCGSAEMFVDVDKVKSAMKKES